ncbi:MAG: prepilin-type N-terminal cleavage/methylation domain-containing protein [Kofleriaceae bacterium]|nr:prepilin-type N-terminal cleavage/methylation domain-containing protein [Kofleriaceae bacterium]
MTRRRSRGFTLIEMMTVLAIIAIMSSIAMVYVNPKLRPIDAAQRLNNLVRTASRQAAQYGPLLASTVTAQGSQRRTRITVSGSTFTLERLQETPTVAWTTVETLVLPSEVTLDSFALAAGAYADVTTQTNWDNFVISCFPTGTCTAASVFFSANHGATRDRRARIAVLPLAAPYVVAGWD